MSHAEAILKHYDVLQRCTTLNFYVIDYLIAEDILDEAQEHDLKTERNPLKQRNLLFQWLKEVLPDKYESFLNVMKDTEQEHVANLLRGSTEEGRLPLSDARYRRLVKIRHKMANATRIDCEVIAELRSLQAISRIDAEEIRAEKVESTKVSKLISVIMRRCNYSYNSFQKVLIKTLQTAAANFLSEGEMPAVHINNNRSDLDGPLSLAFNDLITNKTTDDAEMRSLLDDLDGFGLNPVKAIPGQSIVMFIYCKKVDDAVNFTQIFNSGRLQDLLDRIMNRLLLTIEPQNSEGLHSRISLRDDDIVTLEEFTGIEDWVREDLKMSKRSRKIYVCDATTQTDKSKIEELEGEILRERSSSENLVEERIRYQEELEELEEHKNKIEELEREISREHSRSQNMIEKRQRLQQELEEPNKVHYKDDPVLERTFRTKAAEANGKGISGLAISDDELFITNFQTDEVEVYDLKNLTITRSWKLEHLVNPWDMKYCNVNKCLYIMDATVTFRLKKIFRVDIKGNLLTNWTTEMDRGCISVASDGNVVMAGNKITEYTADGKIVQKMSLEAGVDAKHVIKQSSGLYLISYAGVDGTKNQVCVADDDGDVLMHFGCGSGSAPNRLSNPIHLAIDSSGSVFVLDCDNSRVSMLSSDLKFTRELIPKKKDGMHRPERMAFDEANGRLLVAHAGSYSNDCGVLVFKIL